MIYTYDEDAAERAVEFFPRYLHHVKGEWAGTPFTLADWEKRIVRDLYGWKREDGTRRYRKGLIFVPRKNGKSSIAAGLALKGLCADDEPGAEIYGAAYKQDQAGIIYALAAAMVQKSPTLSKRCRINKTHFRIFVPSTDSFYWAIPNEAAGSHGFNAHMVVFDELHTQKTPELYEALTTAQASRRQPLTLFFSTAGYEMSSVCGREYEYAKKIEAGVIEDDSYYTFIRELPKKADFRDPKVWAICNPGLGSSVKTSFLDEQVRTALLEPTKRNTILRYHFNVWTGADEAWVALERWDACAALGLNRTSMKGQPVHVAVDLAKNYDLAAKALIFPPAQAGGKYRLLCNFYVPANDMKAREDRDRVPYQTWVEQGWITTTPGDVTDYDFITRDVLNDQRDFNLIDVAVDMWNSSQFLVDLQKEGVTGIQFGQGYASMSAPTIELERLILSGRIEHDGNPVLRWMMNHVIVTRDAAGNKKPDKSKNREKIDGVVATIMALGLAMTPVEAPQRWGLVG